MVISTPAGAPAELLAARPPGAQTRAPRQSLWRRLFQTCACSETGARTPSALAAGLVDSCSVQTTRSPTPPCCAAKIGVDARRLFGQQTLNVRAALAIVLTSFWNCCAATRESERCPGNVFSCCSRNAIACSVCPAHRLTTIAVCSAPCSRTGLPCAFWFQCLHCFRERFAFPCGVRCGATVGDARRARLHVLFHVPQAAWFYARSIDNVARDVCVG
jgi:hypothetical protein